MFKKIFLCLFLTTNLYSAEQTETEQTETDKLFTAATSVLILWACSPSSSSEPKYEVSTIALTAFVATVGILIAAIYALQTQEFQEHFAQLSSEDALKEIKGMKIGFTILGIMGGIFGTVYAVAELQPIVKDTYEFMYPTEEQRAIMQAQEKAAHERLVYIKAEKKCRDCFIKNISKPEMNEFNRPVNCEELTQALIMCGGQDEVDRMTNVLNKYAK